MCGNKKRGSRSVAGNTNQKTKKGSRSVTLDGNPDVECGGVLLSHTLSSAVPSPRPGLSFRVRKGTGRLTWAMTTAKPIQRPTHQGIGRQNRNHATIPIVAVREPDNGREQQTLHRYRHRDHKKQHSLPSNERNHHRTRPDPASGSESVPRSPVSTGRLHPSRGFHLRPIEHVFNMRATGTEVPRNPNLGAGFPLRCFQRLSLPNVANRPCRWRDNRHTRGPSTQVLSYYGQASSGFQRAQRIETKLSHDVLNPARVPL